MRIAPSFEFIHTLMPYMNLTPILINKINKSLWWHVTPDDPDAYKKRGKFLASTFLQASFYGRPNNAPENVTISNPLWADSESKLLKILFPDSYKELHISVKDSHAHWYQKRVELDKIIYEKAKLLKYDSVILLTKNGVKELENGRKPSSIELNLCY